jgi:hypothetical protein
MDPTRQDIPICPTFTHLVHSIARDLMPEGWDVIPDAPDTLPDLRDYYAQNKRIAVNEESRYGCTVGDLEAHYAFRAWHDLLHVLDKDASEHFDLPGERRMADRHRQEIVRRIGYCPEASFFGALVEIEIVAQNAHKLRLGVWPEDPRAFALRWLDDRGFDRPQSLGGSVLRPILRPRLELAAASVGG